MIDPEPFEMLIAFVEGKISEEEYHAYCEKKLEEILKLFSK